MQDLVTTYTSLPNLHPALVHFPIALLPVAVGFDLAALFGRRRWLDKAAAVLYAVTALTAWATLWAGEEAADSLVGVPPQVQSHIGTHSDWGHWSLYALAALALLRLLVTWRDRGGERLSLLPARWLLAVAGLAAIGLVFRTADLGGGLVYEHAVAVGKAEAEAGAGTGHRELQAADRRTDESAAGEVAAGEDEAPAASRLVEAPDGTLTWTPLPGDAAALGEVLRPAEGSAGTVSVADGVAAGEGLALAVDGRSLLVLPGSFGSVQVDAEIDLGDFEGTVGVAHHVRGAGDAGLFTVETGGGSALLLQLAGGRRNELDEATAELPGEPFTLSVSAAGRHLKGLLDGRTVTHGHTSPGPDGAAGLLVDGRGTLRVRSLKVTPIGG